jgi:cold shock CspA family protein
LGKQMTDNNKLTGRIIKVSKAGWGFISSRDIEFTRIFFHWTALRQDTLGFKEIETGMNVEFTPIQVPGKGYRAVHVRILDTPREPKSQFPPADEVEYTDLDVPDDSEMPALPE